MAEIGHMLDQWERETDDGAISRLPPIEPHPSAQGALRFLRVRIALWSALGVWMLWLAQGDPRSRLLVFPILIFGSMIIGGEVHRLLVDRKTLRELSSGPPEPDGSSAPIPSRAD